MRKNLNKLIAFGIGISVMTSSIVPALGAEIKTNVISQQIGTKVNSVKTIELQEVIDAAINKDDNIRICTSNINYYKNLQDYYDENDNDYGDYGEDANEVQLKSAKQSREFRVDGVTYEITELYNNIVLMQKQIELQEINVSNKTVETDNEKLKAAQGLITQITLENQEQDLQKEKDKLQNYKNQLTDLQKNMTLKTGIDVSNCKFNDTIKFTPFRVNGDLDKHIDNNIDVITQYSKELIEIYNDEIEDMEDDHYDDLDRLIDDAQDNVKESDYKITDPSTGETKTNTAAYNAAKESAKNGALAQYSGYLQLKNSTEKSDAQIKIQEKTYKNTLRSSYSNILNEENEINQLIAQVNTTNKTIENTKLQYNLGLMTTNNYNNAITGYKQLDIQLRQKINKYYNDITTFEKPWAVSSNR